MLKKEYTFDNVPTSFILDDIVWTKEFDGMFKSWRSPSHRSNTFKKLYTGEKILEEDLPLQTISINEAKNLINSSVFHQQILYCGSNINNKL